MDRWSKDGIYGHLAQIRPGDKNSKKHIYENIKLELTGYMKDIATFMLEAYYNLITMLLRYTDSEKDTLESQGIGEMDILTLFLDQMQQIHYDLYAVRLTAWDKLTIQ